MVRKIVYENADEAKTESVEDMLARTLDVEAYAEELLVNQHWRPIKDIGNGHHGNGADQNSLALVSVNGNEHHDEGATEPKQTLLSRAS